MKRLFSAAVVLIALVMFVSPSYAKELFNPHAQGANEGSAAGLVPPKGFYFIYDSYFIPNQRKYNEHANELSGASAGKLDAYVGIPIFLYSPGLTFLGAQYAAGIAQPFDYISVKGHGQNGGLYNTVLIPFILSWALPDHLFVAPSLAFYLNDGSTSPKDTLYSGVPGNPGGLQGLNISQSKGVYAPSSNGNYTWEPGVGVTWLYNGWNLSASMNIDIPMKNHDTGYLSGCEYWGDYTITKTVGKWTFGAGAYQDYQFTNDSYLGKTVVADPGIYGKGNKYASFGIGPIIGYNFGPVDMTAMYNFNVYTKNGINGDLFNVRWVIPFSL